MKFRSDHKAFVSLKDLLFTILQERLNFFSRKFQVQACHSLTECHLDNNPIKIDLESLPFTHQSLDLALSAGPLMFTNDVPGVLKQWYAAIKPGGIFMASFFGEDTLSELKNCILNVEESLKIPHALRFFPTIATKDAGMLMQRAGFHLPTSDRTRYVFEVKNLRELLSILKAMAGNILYEKSKAQLSKDFFKRVEEEYYVRYPLNAGLKVTTDIVCMTGWAIERYAEERIQQNTKKNIGYL